MQQASLPPRRILPGRLFGSEKSCPAMWLANKLFVQVFEQFQVGQRLRRGRIAVDIGELTTACALRVGVIVEMTPHIDRRYGRSRPHVLGMTIHEGQIEGLGMPGKREIAPEVVAVAPPVRADIWHAEA